MGRFGFGFSMPRRDRPRADAQTTAALVAQHGVGFAFAEPRPVGQYANGDWWVLGPVTITAVTPESMTVDGQHWNNAPYTGRAVHGAMINPGNRVFAPGGLAENNGGNQMQGFEGLAQPLGQNLYDSGRNVDPGMTGAPLVVTTGSVVKFVSRLTNLPDHNRPAGLAMVVLTVVDSIPAPDAIRPGISRANKASPVNIAMFDLSKLQNAPAPASAPSFSEALGWVSRYVETSFPDSINNTVVKGINNHPEYGRDIGNNLHRAMLCLHLDWNSEQKRALIAGLATIADDLVSRAEEGSITLAAGGGTSWKKPVIVMMAALLGENCPTSWREQIGAANNFRWAEDAQIYRVSEFDIALPRFNGDAGPRSSYTYQMLGSAEWFEQGSAAPQRGGSNWNALYRDIVTYSLIGGWLAVRMTEGAEALWEHDELALYMETAWLRRFEGSLGNAVAPFVQDMITAHRPANLAVPQVVQTGVKDAALFLRFDTALNELAPPPGTGDFVVHVNGAPVVVNSVTVWRQNCGLALAEPVAGGDVVTVDYTAGASPLRSVDDVDVGHCTGMAITNNTDKIGGPNGAFPVIQFAPGVQRSIGGTGTLAPANHRFGTIALLKFNPMIIPVGSNEIFGAAQGAPPFRLLLNSNGIAANLELRITNAAGTGIVRVTTPIFSLGTEYDILFSLDMEQVTAAQGINCYINGMAQTLNIITWSGGAGTVAAWNRGASFRWNFTNTATFRIGAFWLDAAARLDLTDAATRAKFTNVTNGNLDILTLGDGVTGSQPAQFHVGNAAQWNAASGINRGSSPNRFFVTSGAVTDAGGSEWG